jgi:hypothetical protein
VQVAYVLNGAPTRAVWEQGQYAAWEAYRAIMALIAKEAAANLPNLPLVSFTGHHRERLGVGMTLIPEFRLLRYVPRPACLSEAPDAVPAATPAADAWSGATQAMPATPRRSGNGAAQMGNATVPLPQGNTTPKPSETSIDDDVVPF